MDDKSQNPPTDDIPKADVARIASRVLPVPLAETDSPLNDNTAEYLADIDSHWSSSYDMFAQPGGKEPFGAARALDEWCRHAVNANVVVIFGHHRESTRWLAESFAHGWKAWKDLRCTVGTKLGGRRTAQVIDEDLLAWEGRCLVVDVWYYLDSELRFRDLPALEKLVQERSHRKFGLVLWTQDTAVRDLPGWPENVYRYPAPPSAATASSRPAHELDAGFFRDLFGENTKSLHDVVKLQEKTVEQTLVRLCVLFGDLPEVDLDELAVAVLGEQGITLGADGADNKGQAYLFKQLWRDGKRFFLQQAGLVCRTGEVPARVGFPTPEIRTLATEIAWEDAEPMIRIFSVIEEMTVLFADESTRHRRDLYEGYVSAAVTLARRVPILCGSRWLEGISEQYMRWVAG